jgi:outer membrane protein OmpA-like peptidoglycan-associated protein
MLLEQDSVSGLPKLLADQWPSIEPHFTDALASMLRFEDTAAFRDTIPAHLRVLSGILQRAAAQPSPAGSGNADGRDVEAEVAPVDQRNIPHRRRRAVYGLLALAVAAVAMVSASLYYHPSQSATVLVLDKPVPKVDFPGASSALAASADAMNGASVPVTIPSEAGASEPAVSGEVASGAVPASDAAASDAGNASAPSAASQVSIEQKAHDTRLVLGVNRVGAAILSATVANEADKSRLIEILDRALGAGRYTADVTVDPQAAPAEWLAQIEALVPLMRISRADITIDGQNIELGGAAGAPGSVWASHIRELFGPSYKVSVFDPVEAVSAATVAFKMAIDNQMKTGSCDGVDRVLNLQVIDFAKSSGHVPATAGGNLNETAQLLKTCTARGQTVALTIESFSDNIGDAEANLNLSAKRAESVRAYLVQAGVPASSLSSKGYGVAQPIAGNLTERGRFANRRIVFAARP